MPSSMADTTGVRSRSACGITFAPIERHFNALKAGEDRDPESKLPHWAHIAAGCSIVMDAANAGTLIDDRASVNDYPESVAHLNDLKRGWVEPQAARQAARP
ncbi:dATP/dGTP diphosphohydrolase domain-containing protein [Microvirga sp. G4-2]|uniref:dATP/dGTP diphosphohydrolase domain-containing protein n=1 Tax=Microvirga sp. G4-2 TaxID=3434467 RepID=UPI0040442D96